MYQPRGLETKLKSLEIIKNEILALQQQGKKIVFTNGCFDILHAGHVDIFQQARNLGDALVVAVNSDISIKKIKGEYYFAYGITFIDDQEIFTLDAETKLKVVGYFKS